jgi:lactate dehydrogenase-like 2-hydroxyacid dehydrogenase
MTAANKPDLLVVCHTTPSLIDDLAANYSVHNLFLAEDKAALLDSVSENIRAILAGGMQGPDAALISRLPKLEIIASNSVGFDATDVAAANARGIVVTHTPDVLTDDVADLGMAFIIMVPRRIAESERYLRAGKWQQARMGLGTNLRGKKLGILGLGRVGSALATRAQGFGLNIGFFDTVTKNATPYRVYASLLEMAADCDILFVSCQGGPSTRKLVDGAVLDALGPNGFLINVARGTIIDQQALVAALREKRIAGAAIDVFEDEPNAPTELFDIEHVVMTPHIASSTTETRRAMADLVHENLRLHFAGEPVKTPVIL